MTGVEPRLTGKPSPVLAEALLRRLGVPAEQVAVVGDAPAEITLARSMGARSIAVLTGALTAAQIAGSRPDLHPDLTVADIAELHLLLASSLTQTPGVLP